VSTLLNWEQCAFRDDDGSLERPNVHDNFVYAFAVHLEDQFLILYTEYRDGNGPNELTDLRFVGLVAHHLIDLVAPSILLDIQRVPAQWVIEQWRELIESRKNYGWPLPKFADLPDLARILTDNGVSGYLVMGSCGMDGFVLARDAEYRSRDRAVEFS
jgi:hypothetical protein